MPRGIPKGMQRVSLAAVDETLVQHSLEVQSADPLASGSELDTGGSVPLQLLDRASVRTNSGHSRLH